MPNTSMTRLTDAERGAWTEPTECPVLVTPEQRIANVIRSLGATAHKRPYAGQIDEVRSIAGQLDELFRAYLDGTLHPKTDDCPF